MVDPQMRELGRKVVDEAIRLKKENAMLKRFLIEALDALEAVDSEILLTGHIKEMVDCALAPRLSGIMEINHDG